MILKPTSNYDAKLKKKKELGIDNSDTFQFYENINKLQYFSWQCSAALMSIRLDGPLESPIKPEGDIYADRWTD